jgi:hypothetical protein
MESDGELLWAFRAPETMPEYPRRKPVRMRLLTCRRE